MGCPSTVDFEEMAVATADMQMQTMVGSEDPAPEEDTKEENK